VAVGADQYALARLFAVGGERLAEAHLDLERLLGRLDVVEVEVAVAAGVAADGTPAARLVDEELLELAVPASNRGLARSSGRPSLR
jgi:hypothetical protein